MDVSLEIWVGTLAFVAVLVAIDLILDRKSEDANAIRDSAIATIIWTAIGIGFTSFVWWHWGATFGTQYLTGYVLERLLSIDNVFVFVLILSFFAVPKNKQHMVLLWGSIGALVLRAIFIFVGATLLNTFSWTVYLFGAILIFTAFKLLRSGEEEMTPENSLVLRWSQKLRNPMLAVFVVIGFTDLVFAVDSIPAVFAITRETYLVFTANAFAVLGLVPLAVLLGGIMHRFIYLKPGLAIVLGLIGVKMMTEHYVHIPIWVSLLTIVVILGGAIALSLAKTRGEAPAH